MKIHYLSLPIISGWLLRTLVVQSTLSLMEAYFPSMEKSFPSLKASTPTESHCLQNPINSDYISTSDNIHGSGNIPVSGNILGSDNIIMTAMLSNLYELDEKVLIKASAGKAPDENDSDAKVIGELPLMSLCIFNGLKKMFFTGFRESRAQQKSLILKNYSQEEAHYFIKTMQCIYSNRIPKTDEEIFFFFSFADEFQLQMEIANYFIKRVTSYQLTWILLAMIAQRYTSVDMGPYVASLFESTKKYLEGKHWSLRDIPLSCFVFPKARHALVSILKQNDIPFEEKEILDMIVQVAEEINTTSSTSGGCADGLKYTISTKAIFDLMAAVRFFFIPQDYLIKQFERLRKVVPDLNLPKSVVTQIERRKNLIANYEHKIPVKMFSVKEELDLNCRGPGYCIIFEEDVKVGLYTTDDNPTRINFELHYLNKFQRMKLKKEQKKHIRLICNKIPADSNAHVGFSIFAQKKEERYWHPIRQQWNWGFLKGANKSLMIEVPIETSRWKVVFHRIFLMPEDNDPFATKIISKLKKGKRPISVNNESNEHSSDSDNDEDAHDHDHGVPNPYLLYLFHQAA